MSEAYRDADGHWRSEIPQWARPTPRDIPPILTVQAKRIFIGPWIDTSKSQGDLPPQSPTAEPLPSAPDQSSIPSEPRTLADLIKDELQQKTPDDEEDSPELRRMRERTRRFAQQEEQTQ